MGLKKSDLAVGTEVGSRNLKGDLVVGEFVHFLSQKVGFSHQSVGLDDLLPESRQTLAEKLIPASQDVSQTYRELIRTKHSFMRWKTYDVVHT